MQNYTDGDILLTLKLVSTPMGRKKISAILGLGEATIRTLLRRLEGEHLILSTRQGQRLTEKGREYLSGKPYFTFPQHVDAGDLTLSPCNCASLVRGFAHNIRNGIILRDAAILSGGGGATTLVFLKGTFRFPQSQTVVDSEISERLKVFSSRDGVPREGDILIIATADTEKRAMRGMAGCLGLLVKEG